MGIFFEKNFELYKIKYLKASVEYEKYLKNRENKEEICTDLDCVGSTIYAVEKNGRKWYLDSRYNSKEAATVWGNAFDDAKLYSIFLVFGLANTDKIRALYNGISDTCDIIVYEPSIEIFHKVMNDKDLGDLIKSERILICVKGLHDVLLSDYLTHIMNFERVNNTHIVALPNYDRLFKSEMEEFLTMVDDVYKNKMILCNTAKSLGRQFNRQCFNNMFFMLNSSTINIAARCARKKGYDKTTAILVAGGPSLDKNVEEIRNAKGKCLILCVDTAIRSLLRRDIVPDIIISVDANKPLELFEDERVRDIPFIGCMQSRYEIMKNCKAKRILYANNFFARNFYSMYGEEVSTLYTNGSVANDGFSFLQFIGIKNIILVGQDCAFTGNKRHNSDSYSEEEFKVQDGMFLVDGYYGEPVYTDLVYNNYRKFFETEIKKDDKLHVINGTEGGALIKGAINMPLKDAISQYCTDAINWEEFFDSLPNGIPEENLKKAELGLFGVKDEFEDMSVLLKKQLDNNKKLYELLKKNKVDSKEYKKLVSNIGELNNQIDSNQLMEMVYLNASVTDYEVLENVYDVKSDAKEDLEEICINSIKLLNAYIEETAQIINTLEEVYSRHR